MAEKTEIFFKKCLNFQIVYLQIKEVYENATDSCITFTPYSVSDAEISCGNHSSLVKAIHPSQIDSRIIWGLPDFSAFDLFSKSNEAQSLEILGLVVFESSGPDKSSALDQLLLHSYDYKKYMASSSVSLYMPNPSKNIQRKVNLMKHRNDSMLSDLFCNDRNNIRAIPWRASFMWKNCP